MKPGGKVIVVTGGGNGVGRAVTLEALRRGARVRCEQHAPKHKRTEAADAQLEVGARTHRRLTAAACRRLHVTRPCCRPVHQAGRRFRIPRRLIKWSQ